ncbi:helix-turn-helix domain-containing protein [Streptomyces sp. NPDC004647]|uniref:MmyB family transcriptional regulator n=1 Tax=Streptomyces sp. NPDC004647 TaxID=3154671 RepID=UPI0033BC2B27
MVHAEAEISSFLKARRAALDPDELGLPDGATRRRVRGLRREEVAQLAGISVDYYTRIEQGRSRNISDSVLDAVARALRMTAAEHTYLRNIALPRRRSADDEPASAQRVRPEVRRLLDAVDGTVPAFIYGRGLDMLAWNRLGGLVCFGYGPVPGPEPVPNGALLVFLDPDARTFYPEWDQIAQETVAVLRAEAGRHPEDPRLNRILGELHERSDIFRRLWEEQAVRERYNGVKRIMHPAVGELNLTYETFRLPVDPDQVLCTYIAEPGTATADALRLLAAAGREAGSLARQGPTGGR